MGMGVNTDKYSNNKTLFYAGNDGYENLSAYLEGINRDSVKLTFKEI